MAENIRQKEERKKRDEKIRELYPMFTYEEIALMNKKKNGKPLTVERVRQIVNGK